MKKHKHAYGGRPQLLHDRISMLITFERDRLQEFEQRCDEQNISISEGIRQLVEKTLEKNAVGPTSELNPLNLPVMLEVSSTYNTAANKPFQSDLTQWFEVVDQIDSHAALGMFKGQALEIARRADKRSMELRKNGIHR